jgi:threonine synthase
VNPPQRPKDAKVETSQGVLVALAATALAGVFGATFLIGRESAREDELANAAALADRCGMFNCPPTGVALAALIKLKERGEIAPDERVIVISTANELKFSEFKVGHHRGTLEGVTARHANLPVELPAHFDAVRRAIDERTRGES